MQSLSGIATPKPILQPDNEHHFYLPGRSGLYPGYPDTITETIIITESIIAAATLQLYTTYKALSLFGMNVLNEEHKVAL